MATYYFRNVGNNWGDAANWSLTDGGGATGAVPTAADDAYFTSNSGNCTVNASARVCKTLIFAGVGAGDYPNTITMTNGITVSGNATLSSTMTIAGAGGLTINTTSTYTSNGKTWPNELRITGLITLTLADNSTIGSLYSTNGTNTVNSNTLSITNNLTIDTATTGSTILKLIGTGNLSSTLTNRVLNNDLTIDTTGTITVSSTLAYSNSTRVKLLKFVNGTLINTNGILIDNINNSIESNGNNWGNITLNGTINCNDTVIVNNLTTTGTPLINSNNINVNGNLTIGAGTAGTATLNLTGTGTWSHSVDNRIVTMNTVINTIGTLILSGNVRYGGASSTLTFTAGTISPGTSTFIVSAGTTYNISSSGFTLYNFSPLTGTHTINTGTITVTNNMTFNGNTTFAGTGGWTVANINDTTAGRTLTLKDGSTYTITTAMTTTGTNASPFVITSSSATLRAILTLNYGASQTVQFVKATRIDSSGGQTIWDTVGTIASPLTDTINWNSGARPAAYNSIKIG